MSGLAASRLKEERRRWRRDHPFQFWARCMNQPDGTRDLFKWEAGIPGKEGTDWEGGVYRLRIEFSEEYPVKPPRCLFIPPLFHPNIYPSGVVCLSILSENAENGWQPSLTLRDILLGIQDLLNNPNLADPAQIEATEVWRRSQEEYKREIQRQAQNRRPS